VEERADAEEAHEAETIDRRGEGGTVGLRREEEDEEGGQ
jgi:hypothetical protein